MQSLEAEFARRYGLNARGGWLARFSRWRVLHWLLLQRLGINRWVRVPLFFGEHMWVLTGETTSSSMLGFGYSEPTITALMLRLLRPGMRFVDVGAHLGYEAVLASVLVGSTGKVVSFEPQPQIVEWTARNLEQFPNARIVRAAAGEATGTIQFTELEILRSAFSGAAICEEMGRRISVPVTTLDEALDVCERPVDFLKCDAEGAEMSVLRGAERILREDKPFLVLEAEMPPESGPRPRVDEFERYLRPFGYEGVYFDYDGNLKMAALGKMKVHHANVAFVPKQKLGEFSLTNPAVIEGL
jgi:FkbM family methyltransferase